MVEIKIDRASLPKDGQKIRWQTQSDIINGTWKEGVFCEEENAFNVGFEDVVQHWDLAWDVHHWEVLSYDISDVMCSYFMETIKEFENLTQLSKFEKQNKNKLRISNIDYDTETKLWTVTFIHL
jgi:hypothetical protein